MRFKEDVTWYPGKPVTLESLTDMYFNDLALMYGKLECKLSNIDPSNYERRSNKWIINKIATYSNQLSITPGADLGYDSDEHAYFTKEHEFPPEYWHKRYLPVVTITPVGNPTIPQTVTINNVTPSRITYTVFVPEKRTIERDREFNLSIFAVGVRGEDSIILDSDINHTPGPPDTGLQVWYDAQSLSGYSNGQSVPSWPDLSGHSGAATQPTTTAQPTYLSSGINGRPALKFDANQYFNMPSVDSVKVLEECTIAAVVLDRMDVADSTRTFIERTQSIRAIHATSPLRWKYEVAKSSSLFVSVIGPNVQANTPILYIGNHSVNDGEINLRINGIDQGTKTGLTEINSGTSWQIARRDSTAFGAFTIGEILVYKRRLTKNEIEDLEYHLANKWGLSI
jgi:hypothetical protein